MPEATGPSQPSSSPEMPYTPRPSGKLLFILFLIVIGIAVFAVKYRWSLPSAPNGKAPTLTSGKLTQFSSESQFKTYLEKAQELTNFYGRGIATFRTLEGAMPPSVDMGMQVEKSADGGVDRVSETNVQVKGIDEPDIVKTDGKNLFVSRTSPYYLMGKPLPAARMAPSVETNPMMIAPDFYPQPQPTSETSIITTLPVTELRKAGKVEESGDLLLYKNYLLIFATQTVHGYDVSNSASPISVWEKKLDDRQQIVTSRLLGGKVYLVTRSQVDYGSPCPIPLFTGNETRIIPCIEIYHPETVIPVDVTYTAMVINPTTGTVDKTVSFLGKSDSSVVYMSTDALYVTYSFTGNMFDLMYGFYTTDGRNLVSPIITARLEKLNTYDLSMGTKLTEMQSVIERYNQNLSEDERLRIQNETQNRLADYMKVRSRELEATGIVKIDLDKLTVVANGEVPGRPLNQFALDEFENHLRIATTFGGGWWGFGSTTESASDVYVLNSDLSMVSSVKDLGVGERIYSVRFIEDRGYVVTFKQIDPFYILDLSNPNNPQKKGELKIPGFSSYLHPLAKNKILGVGQENGKVKLSLFDVRSAENPSEIAKYTLDEYWTEVSQNHHAFLQDEQHQIFFLPGGQGGYVFSYKGDELSLNKAVSESQIKRAVFINDYLYLVGEQNITVLDENTWAEVNSLELN